MTTLTSSTQTVSPNLSGSSINVYLDRNGAINAFYVNGTGLKKLASDAGLPISAKGNCATNAIEALRAFIPQCGLVKGVGNGYLTYKPAPAVVASVNSVVIDQDAVNAKAMLVQAQRELKSLISLNNALQGEVQALKAQLEAKAPKKRAPKAKKVDVQAEAEAFDPGMPDCDPAYDALA